MIVAGKGGAETIANNNRKTMDYIFPSSYSPRLSLQLLVNSEEETNTQTKCQKLVPALVHASLFPLLVCDIFLGLIPLKNIGARVLLDVKSVSPAALLSNNLDTAFATF